MYSDKFVFSTVQIQGIAKVFPLHNNLIGIYIVGKFELMETLVMNVTHSYRRVLFKYTCSQTPKTKIFTQTLVLQKKIQKKVINK